VAGTLWVVGPDGMPKALRVRIGVTDGATTEVAGADLSVGLEVIMGGGPKTAPQANSSGPRLM